MDRIEKPYPGENGIVRVVNMRSKTDTYNRSIVKIYPQDEQTFDEVPQVGGR